MKNRKVLVSTLIVCLILGALLLAPKIKELLALKQYADTFEADVIDENFRSLFLQNAHIEIPASDSPSVLNIIKHANPLPETFDYYGDQLNVEEFFKDTQTTGLMVVHGADVIYENYYRGNDANDHVLMASVSKSMLSMLTGVAVNDGLIDLDEKASKYAKELTGTAYDKVTVRNVINMSTGISWSEDYGDLNSELVRSLVVMSLGSLDEFALSMKADHEPGTVNLYASINTHVLGMVLRGATGKTYEEYFYQKLWSRIGSESSVKMLVDSEGEPLAFGGANIRLRDMARFGMLYLNRGKNHLGEQLVPTEWIQRSSTPDAAHLMPADNGKDISTKFGYSNHWWIPASQYGGDYFAIGIYGQFIYINPKHKVMIAKTSAYVDYVASGGWMELETSKAFQAISKHLSEQ